MRKSAGYVALMPTLMIALVVSAGAQTIDSPTLSLEGARKAIAAAKAEAAAKQAPGGVIAVVDSGGNLMALERLDGTFAAGANISVGKARTAALFKRPTRVFEELINKGRTAMAALHAPARRCADHRGWKDRGRCRREWRGLGAAGRGARDCCGVCVVLTVTGGHIGRSGDRRGVLSGE